MTTKLWSVSVEFADAFADGDDLVEAINDRSELFLDELAGHNASVSGCPEEPNGVIRYGATIFVEEDSAAAAAATGAALVQAAARSTHMPELPLVRLELIEDSELERELLRPVHPNLLGVGELASLLGVSKQRASELARSSGFVKPFAELASGPVWLKPNVRRFIRNWERKPGRPKKARV